MRQSPILTAPESFMPPVLELGGIALFGGTKDGIDAQVKTSTDLDVGGIFVCHWDDESEVSWARKNGVWDSAGTIITIGAGRESAVIALIDRSFRIIDSHFKGLPDGITFAKAHQAVRQWAEGHVDYARRRFES